MCECECGSVSVSMLFTDVYVYIIPTYHRNSSTSLLVFLLPLLLWLPQCLAFICCMYFSVPHTHTHTHMHAQGWQRESKPFETGQNENYALFGIKFMNNELPSSSMCAAAAVLRSPASLKEFILCHNYTPHTDSD